MVYTAHLARTDDILQYTVCLKEYMFAVVDLYLAAADGIDERQFGQPTIIQFRQRLNNLFESRLLDKH